LVGKPAQPVNLASQRKLYAAEVLGPVSVLAEKSRDFVCPPIQYLGDLSARCF
jgi:hypothetical protein